METSGHFKLLNVVLALIGVLISVEPILFILLFLIVFDTVLGITRSFKFKTFGSSNLSKGFIKKTLLYGILILLCTGIEYVVFFCVGVNIKILSYASMMLCLIEFFSAMENLSDLGIKIPYANVFTKLKNNIPLIPKLTRSLDLIVDGGKYTLCEDFYEIYKTWVVHTNEIVDDIEQCEFKNKLNTADISIIIESRTKVVESVLLKLIHSNKYSNGSYNHTELEYIHYINYLLQLYKLYTPTNRQNYYMLINKGIIYDEFETKSCTTLESTTNR